MSNDKIPVELREFRTKDDLIEAYRIQIELDGQDILASKAIAITAAKYTPHLYRGGYVIRDFGYSTERTSSGRLQKGRDGNPYAV
jgi:hypothetical protein